MPRQDPPSQISTHRHDPDRKSCPATEKRVREGACCADSWRPGANMSAAAPQPSTVGPSAQWRRVRKRTCPGWTWSPSTEKTDGALITCPGCTLHCSYLHAFVRALPSTLHALPDFQVPSILRDQRKCHLLWGVCPDATSGDDLSLCLCLYWSISNLLPQVPATLGLSVEDHHVSSMKTSGP